MTSVREQPLGIGCMRLSTVVDRDRAQGIAVVHAALDAGVRLLDTADAYALDQADVGHNERLIAEALRTWHGDVAAVTVATKGGLTRPGGRWVPNGSAKHLRAACEASLRALDVPQIALYQLHAPDPRRSLRTSVTALAQLKQDGLVARIGLCNVNRAELQAALSWADIDAVQVALSPFDDEALYGGVAELCEAEGILLVAHTPLGGPKQRRRLCRHPALGRVATRYGCTPAAVASSWLRDLSRAIVPIPGPSRVETARQCAALPELDDTDRAELDAALRGGAWLRAGRKRRPPDDSERRVVILMGMQGAGKSRAAAELEDHERLNRDEVGGTLAELNPALEAGLDAGTKRWVLDNTYATRASRARVLDAAWRHGAAVDCRWLDTPLPQAQINAVRRLLAKYGRLPDPAELSKLRKTDPQAFDPRAQFRYQRALEPPSDDEGFASLQRLPFERLPSPHTGSALLVQIEGVLRASKRGDRAPLTEDDVVVDPRRADALRARGDKLLGISWQPAIASGEVSREQVEAVFSYTLAQLDLDIDIRFCAHAAGPPKCWCRTPIPGLAVELLDAHRVDPARCTMVGRSAPDKTLGERMSLTYADHEAFFGGPFSPAS